MPGWPSEAFAFLGGLLVNLLVFSERRHLPKRKRPPLDLPYWLWFFGGPAFGALMVGAYQLDGEQVGRILAINIGASAPAIARALMSPGANALPKGDTD